MPGENGTGPSSLDEIRALYATEIPDGPLYVPIRRKARAKLIVAYNEQDWVETQEAGRRWADSQDPKADLYRQAEILAKSVRDIYKRDDEHGTVLRNTNAREPFDGKYLPGLGQGGGPMNFHSAAMALGLPLPGGEDDALVAVFLVLGGDWEVELHSQQLAAYEPGELTEQRLEKARGKFEPAEPVAT